MCLGIGSTWQGCSGQTFWPGICLKVCFTLVPITASLNEVTKATVVVLIPALILVHCADFKSHCFEAYNRRCSEMDNELCRLALFLDPRYKAGAASLGSISPIIVKISTLLSCLSFHIQNKLYLQLVRLVLLSSYVR